MSQQLSKKATNVFRTITAGLEVGDSHKFDAGHGYMPLSVERLAPNVYSLTHYYEQNGDLVFDPDMEFWVEQGPHGPVVVPLSIQLALGGYHVAAKNDGERITHKNAHEVAEQVSFANMWMENIRQQQDIGSYRGHQPSRPTQIQQSGQDEVLKATSDRPQDESPSDAERWLVDQEAMRLGLRRMQSTGGLRPQDVVSRISAKASDPLRPELSIESFEVVRVLTGKFHYDDAGKIIESGPLSGWFARLPLLHMTILNDNLIEYLGEIEGPEWVALQRADQLSPTTVTANRDAFEVLRDMGEQAQGLRISDILDGGGIIVGASHLGSRRLYHIDPPPSGHLWWEVVKG